MVYHDPGNYPTESVVEFGQPGERVEAKVLGEVGEGNDVDGDVGGFLKALSSTALSYTDTHNDGCDMLIDTKFGEGVHLVNTHFKHALVSFVSVESVPGSKVSRRVQKLPKMPSGTKGTRIE